MLATAAFPQQPLGIEEQSLIQYAPQVVNHFDKSQLPAFKRWRARNLHFPLDLVSCSQDWQDEGVLWRDALSPRGGLSVLHHSAATLLADLALALMDSGRCPVSPPWLKQACCRAFSGGGEESFYILLRGLWRHGQYLDSYF